jgi:hypothetical protein
MVFGELPRLIPIARDDQAHYPHTPSYRAASPQVAMRALDRIARHQHGCSVRLQDGRQQIRGTKAPREDFPSHAIRQCWQRSTFGQIRTAVWTRRGMLPA